MRWTAVALLVLLCAGPAPAPLQQNRLPLSSQPARIDLAFAKRLTANCTTTTLAEADKEVRKRLRSELLKGTAVAVIEFVAAEEPAGRAAEGFLPILLRSIRKPVLLGALSYSELSLYGKRGYTPQSQFEVCRPKALLEDAIVIRPVAAPTQSGLNWPYVPQVKSLPTLSLNDLHALGAPAGSPSLLTPRPPGCDALPPSLPHSLLAEMAGIAEISGVVSITGKYLVPAPASALVSLTGPPNVMCSTPETGVFRFHDLPPGKYTLQVRRTFFTAPSVFVVLGAGDSKQINFALKPLF